MLRLRTKETQDGGWVLSAPFPRPPKPSCRGRAQIPYPKPQLPNTSLTSLKHTFTSDLCGSHTQCSVSTASNFQQNGCSLSSERNVQLYNETGILPQNPDQDGWREGRTADGGSRRKKEHTRSLNSCFFTVPQLSFWEGCAAGHSKRILQVLC